MLKLLAMVMLAVFLKVAEVIPTFAARHRVPVARTVLADAKVLS